MSNKNKFKVLFGVILIIIGFVYSNYWFFLGIIPIIVGITNFCPLCVLMNKCSIKR